MANVTMTQTQFWSMIALGAITLIYLVYASFDFQGQADRALINERISQILTGLDETLEQLAQADHDREARSNRSSSVQNATLGEIRDLQRGSEERAQRLVPPFERFINQTDEMVNATDEMLNKTEEISEFINFIGSQFGQEYLDRENFQYRQANETAAALREVLNLLNETA